MRFNPKYFHRFILIGGTLVALSCAPGSALAQQSGSQSQTQYSTQNQGQYQMQGQNFHAEDWAAFNEFLEAHPDVAEALRSNPDLLYDQNFMGQHAQLKGFCDAHPHLRQDMDANRPQFRNWFRERREVTIMNQYFSTHADVERQLIANPKLIENPNFLQQHYELQDFLNSHPGARQTFDQNPELFMRLEARFQDSTKLGYRAVNDRDNNNGANPYPNRNTNPNSNSNPNYNDRPDVTRTDLAKVDRFLDSHPDIEKQLEANPELVKNPDFMKDHPEFLNFLNDNPPLRDTFRDNPQFFMNRENRYENSPADRAADRDANGNPYPNRNPNPDLTRPEVASMDQFLDGHPDIDKQLEANPSLINNAKYLNDHPQLRDFLTAHAEVREEFTENPSYFMHRENQFDRNDNNPATVATMDQYLDKHPDEARDLNAYPARVNDSDYLSHHKDLDAYLKKHPDVREEFTHNPSAFMHQESSFDAYAQMDDFLDNHKNVGKELSQNPQNVQSADYLDHHKDLKKFLDKNPGVGDQFRTNPNDFMDRERHFEANREMDVYLSNHKNVSKDLQKNPDQVKDAKYLDHHKDLKELMDKNPELAKSAQTNPSGFIQEQMKFHEQYKNQHTQQKTKVEERAKVHGAQ